MKFNKNFLPLVLVIFFYQSLLQAKTCSEIFTAKTTARKLFKTLIDQLSSKELAQIKEDVIRFDKTDEILSLLNPRWEEVQPLSLSDAVYFSLKKHIQRFRLQKEDLTEGAPTLHFIYTTSNSLGRIAGPRLVLMHVILGPYNLNRIDLNTQTIEILNRELQKILLEWSKERNADISSVQVREIGL